MLEVARSTLEPSSGAGAVDLVRLFKRLALLLEVSVFPWHVSIFLGATNNSQVATAVLALRAALGPQVVALGEEAVVVAAAAAAAANLVVTPFARA